MSGGARSLARVLRDAPRRQVAGLMAVMIGAGLTEGAGLLMLVPLLELMQNRGASALPVVRAITAALGSIGLQMSIGAILVAFVTIVSISAALQYGRSVASAEVQAKWVDRVRTRCYAALLNADYRWLVSRRQSDHAALLLTDVARVGVGLNAVINLIALSVTAVAYLSVTAFLSPVLTGVALVGGVLAWWLMSGQRRQAMIMGSEFGVANRRMQAQVQDSLAGLKLSKVTGSEARQLEGFVGATTELRERQLRFVRSTSRVRLVMQVAAAVLLALFVEAGLTVWHTPFSQLVILVVVAGRLTPMFASGQQFIHNWLNGVPALAHIETLIADCAAVAEPAAGTDVSEPLAVQEAICLDDVSLSRPGQARPALAGIRMRLAARTTTAVVGASGAGKTTLADVLAGLLPPDTGQLTVDGRPITGALRMRWRRSVAYVTQEVFLVHDSIRANLCWGGSTADDATLTQALRRAAADFVFALPRQLDTIIGDGGLTLSGGERQRLALARALLQRPALLILDEATSALDLESEARVRSAIEGLHGDLTVLVIGHRLATLEHADQVLVIEDGRIAQSGTWAQVRTRQAASTLPA